MATVVVGIGLQAFAATSKVASTTQSSRPSAQLQGPPSTATSTLSQSLKFEGDTTGIPTAENAPLGKDEYQKEIAAATERASRAIASQSNFDAMMSEPFKKLRADLLSVRSSEELDQKL